MREILFRGKRLDNGEWVEGCFVEKKDPLLESDVRNAFILAQARGDSFVTWFPVDPSTVGQFTGLLDKNGKLIFEGDILSLRTSRAHEVKFDVGGFFMEGTAIPFKHAGKFAIIGNIHDNPKLLEANEYE